MILTIIMSATPDKSKPNIDKIIKSNKHLRRAAHSSKTNRKHHRVAIDQLDSFLDLIDNAIDVMNNTTVEIEKSQEKLYELYDFCGEVPFDDSCDY